MGRSTTVRLRLPYSRARSADQLGPRVRALRAQQRHCHPAPPGGGPRRPGAPRRLRSSSSVYGQAETLPTAENAMPRPASPYGVTKLAAEHLCSAYADVCELDIVALHLLRVRTPPATRHDLCRLVRFASFYPGRSTCRVSVSASRLHVHCTLSGPAGVPPPPSETGCQRWATEPRARHRRCRGPSPRRSATSPPTVSG